MLRLGRLSGDRFWWKKQLEYLFPVAYAQSGYSGCICRTVDGPFRFKRDYRTEILSQVDRCVYNDEYSEKLRIARYGINQTKEEIYELDRLITPLIKEKHQSIGHIYANHPDEITYLLFLVLIYQMNFL